MNKLKGFSIIFFLLFLIILILVLTNKMIVFDTEVYNSITYIRNSNMDLFFKMITKLANTSIIIVMATLLVITFEKKEKVQLLITLLTTLMSNLIIKHIIQRARPDHIRLIVEKSYSFPSGHAMISVALYGFLIYYISQKVSNKTVKVIAISFLVLLILLIGISRIYVGVHYPSDVLAGYFLSLSILLGIIDRGMVYGKNDSK